MSSLIALYGVLNQLESEFSYCTFIFEILGIILTFITFLTVMMSVQYQENVYNAKELEFEIKNEKDFLEINKKIQKLKFIEDSKKNYQKSINIFIVSSIIMLMIIAGVAPIYYVGANALLKIALVCVQIFLTVVVFVLYNFFEKDLKKDYYFKLTNAANYKKSFSSEINVFPSFDFKEGFAILTPAIPDLNNYFVAIKINFGISDFVILGYKSSSRGIDLDNLPNLKLPFDLEKKGQILEIDYYVKIEETFLCMETRLSEDSGIIQPIKIKNKDVTKDIIEFEKNIKENQLEIKREKKL